MAKKTKSHRKVIVEIYKTLYRVFGPQRWWPGDTPFEVAVGAVLTQNTNWGNVEKAIKNLKDNNALDAHVMHRMRNKRLAMLIQPAGYFNVKTRRLKAFLKFLVNHYKGDMGAMRARDTGILREELLNIHGIGPETADSIILYALERPVFVVDAYTKRVMQRHGLVSEKTTYHEMQEVFHKNLSHDTGYFNEYHALFVKLGKDYCRPKMKCDGCPLAYLFQKKISI
jgi:endonuclease-3 related protein